MLSNPVEEAQVEDPTTVGTDAVSRGRRTVALVMIGAGLFYTAASLRLDRGDLAHPGPGLFPLLVGVLAVLSGGLGLLEVRRQVPVTVAERSSGPRPWLFLAAMGLGIVLLPLVGYVVSALVLGTAVSRVAGQRTWWKALLTGVLIALVTTYLFRDVLDVFLPAWIVDEWL